MTLLESETPSSPTSQASKQDYDFTAEISLNDLTVVIPTLNEAKGLPVVVEQVKKAGFQRILVIDGGSTDGTVDVAHSLGLYVMLQHGKGKSAAVDTAVSLVKTKYIGFIDADGTYDPEDFRKMLAYATMADMVVGSRLLGTNGKKGRPFVPGHGVVNKLFNRLFNLIYDCHLTDILSGIRICNMDALRGIRFRSAGFSIEAELCAQILSEGGKVIEVPASFRERIGTAKLRYRDGYHILTTIMRLAYEFNPLLYFIPVGLLVFVPGLGIVSYVIIEAAKTSSPVFHSGWALAGLGMTIAGIQLIGFSILSFLMKRIEYRQLRAIRKLGLGLIKT
ncbi:MAG TPA: glycosyltransferase family 2 protein [Nitrososphaerales archaeon]|nr:glycosyltransferase family 2 protein [Nitrososphaerales archaeon]